ncbi:iron ABC transporter permease [Enterocloster asparagiformis]|uniref:ABC transporter permease n=1 Tax=Enterocloster asparagiformis TaxID=333367 RepID=UPI002A7EF4B6|nr:iron ABC transporter permease [Enterocloster asparagiformis]
MKKKQKIDMWMGISLGILLLYIVFMLYPLLKILVQSVLDNEQGTFTMQYFKQFFSRNLGIEMPSIYGFNGILLVLATKLFPLVFLYVSGALKNIDNSLLEASSNMGCRGVKRFFKVVVPLCMPSILAAALMVFMRALADFGTPLLIGEGYRTFPVEIYKHNFAAAVSVIAIIITAIVFLIQKMLSNHYSFTMNALHPIERKKPHPVLSFFAHFYAYGLVAVSFLPQFYLIYCSFRNTSKTGNMFKPGYSLMSYRQIFETMGDAVKNTIVICGSALVLIILLAVLIAYLVVRRRNHVNNIIDTLSMLPYIIPGSVVGIALVMGFSKGPLVLTGTAAIMVVSMCIRRIPYTIRSSVAILQQIPITVEEASASLGASKFKTFWKVTTPMMVNGIMSGAILSWVTLITELSSSIILYSSKTITLNLGVYIMVSRGTDGKACAISTILTVMTIISLVLVTKLSKGREITL